MWLYRITCPVSPRVLPGRASRDNQRTADNDCDAADQQRRSRLLPSFDACSVLRDEVEHVVRLHVILYSHIETIAIYEGPSQTAHEHIKTVTSGNRLHALVRIADYRWFTQRRPGM